MADIKQIQIGADLYDIRDANAMQKGVDYVTAGQLAGSTLGSKATAEGEDTEASGAYSHAEGGETIASGVAAHVEGIRTVASAQASHAEGLETTASAIYAHAEGQNTLASGQRSHAEGSNTIASAGRSHAEGHYVFVHAQDAHGEGQGNRTEAGLTHVQGTGHSVPSSQVLSSVLGVNSLVTSETGKTVSVTIKNDDGTTASTVSRILGKYAEVVGNGDSDAQRSNARTLDWSGNEILAGKLTVGAGPTNSMDVATKQYVDTHSSSATTATATLTSAGWSNNQQTVTVTGVTANNTLIISPAPANTQLYSMCNVYATVQAANSLTFQCETTPYTDLVVNVVIL